MNPLPNCPKHNRDALGGRGRPRTALVLADKEGKPLAWWFGKPWRKALRAAQEHAYAALWSIDVRRGGRHESVLATVWEAL